jgi:hypothetical protein
MKKNILLAVLFISSFTLMAQSSRDLNKSTRLSETSEKVVVKKNENQRVSDYFQFEKKIAKWSISNDIPSSTPIHKDGQSRNDYAEVLLDWAKNNQNLIKEEFRDKLTDPVKYNQLLNNIKRTK